jgi:hypothetical protein
MDAQNAERPGNAHEHSDVHERSLEPFLARVTAMDETAVHADRMTEQQ